MKRFLKKSWRGIPVGIVSAVLALVLVAGGVFAAWDSTTLDSTGTITVEATHTFDYSFDPTVLAFGDNTVQVNNPIEVDVTVTVTNTGNQDIAGFLITPIGLPEGMTAGYVGWDVPIPAGGTGELQFILSVTPTETGTIDLSGITFELTPHDSNY